MDSTDEYETTTYESKYVYDIELRPYEYERLGVYTYRTFDFVCFRVCLVFGRYLPTYLPRTYEQTSR